MAPRLLFSIHTLSNIDGHVLRKAKPDSKGIYRSVPAIILGKYSDNGFLYEETSTIEQINGKNSGFNKKVSQGNLEGEIQHPDLSGLPTKEQRIERTRKVNREFVSHYICGADVLALDGNRQFLITIDLKPFGKFGDVLKAALDDPDRNCSWSLRALVEMIRCQDQIARRKMVNLITVDAETAPGFPDCSKRYMPATEGLDADAFSSRTKELIDIDTDAEYVVNHCADEIATESLDSLKNFLDTNKVCLGQSLIGTFDPTNGSVRDMLRQPQSVFHTLFK